MINFKSKIDIFLPYDRKKYIDLKKWYGVSFQLNNIGKIIISDYISKYEFLIKNVVDKFDNSSIWIINHDDKDFAWFPNNYNNLPTLRKLFKENNIPNNFKGGLLMNKEEFSIYLKDLLLYPYLVIGKDDFLYKNIDISNSEFPFVMKISGHLNVDLLSENENFLKEFITEFSSDDFIIKYYRKNNW